MSDSWRLAESLKTLQNQLNGLFPARDKQSDGTIGDAAHSTRTSDHNPNRAGVVCAFDVTNNVVRGIDCRALAGALFAANDARIKYLIFDHRITKKDKSGWKPYTGINAHRHHLHISVVSSHLTVYLNLMGSFCAVSKACI